MKDKSTHLNEDQILFSLVDENDLSDDTKNHLLACPVCQDKKMGLAAELERLGEMVKDFTPASQKRPLPPSQESRHFSFRLPAFAAGFALVLLIACIWGLALFTDSSKQMTAQLSTEMKEGLDLMEDIMEEAVLPEYYLDIAVASYSYFDDEFLEFVVPLEARDNSV
jgi:hypothetical protein